MTAVTEQRASIKWVPKKWKPVYEQMILLAFMGRKQKDIAKMFGYTAVQVSNILNSPQALVLKQTLTNKVIGEARDAIPQSLRATAIDAVKKMKIALGDEKLWAANPLGAIDRTLKLLSAIGEVKAEGGINVTNIEKQLIVDNEVGDRLRKALEISERGIEVTGEVEIGRAHV